MERLVLLEPFTAEEDGEISVKKGEIVFVLESDQDGWTYVQNNEGVAGLVPSGYTVPYEEPTVSIEPTFSNELNEEFEEEINFKPDERINSEDTPEIESKEDESLNIDTNTVSSKKLLQTSPQILEVSPRNTKPTMVSPRGKLEKSGLIELTPVILRIYTNEEVQREIEDRELANPKLLRTFKSIRATTKTPVKQIIEDVAKKLLIADSRQFHLFTIDRKALTMKVLRENERPVDILNNSVEDVEFALIFAPKVKIKEIKNTEVKWQPEPGDLSHRRLLNDQTYLKFADLVFNVGNAELSTFQAIPEIRFPELLDIDESLVKKKKEKNMAHGIGYWVKFNDGVITLEILQQIFDYMYTGQLDFLNIDLEFLVQIYKAAKQLKYSQLMQYTRSQIEKNIGLHNIFLILKFTDSYELDEIKKFAINFCLNNWQAVSASKEGLNIIGLSLFQEITVFKAGMEGTPPLTPPTEPPENTIIEDFQKIRSLMHFADAVSVFGNLIIPYHRCILAAASPKFLTMFLKESGSSKKLPQYNFNVSGGAFKGLIDLIYSGTTNMSANEACEILEHIAVPFDLHSVREDCEALICQPSVIDKDSVMNVLKITYLKVNDGRAHLTINARNNCLSFIVANFRDIDMETLKTFETTTAWEILQLIHVRCKKHNIIGLS